jgi:hypothetical protein
MYERADKHRFGKPKGKRPRVRSKCKLRGKNRNGSERSKLSMWTGLNWLRIRSGSGQLRTR